MSSEYSSRSTSVIAWIVILGVIGYVFWDTNFSRTGRHGVMAAGGNASDIQFKITARLAVGNAAFQEAMTGKPITRAYGMLLMESVDANAKTARQREAAAIVAGEIVGKKETVRRLNKLREIPALKPEIAILNAIFSGKESVRDVPSDDCIRLRKKLGWFGNLALVQGLARDDPARENVIAPVTRSLAIISAGTVLLVMIGVIGFALLITALVLFNLGKMRWKLIPSAAGSGYLESFAVYVLLYVGFGEAAMRLMPHVHLPKFVWYCIVCSAFPIALAWPIARRAVSWRELFNQLGWHRGNSRSAIVEMLLGIVGYITCLPIIAIGFSITALIIRFTHIDASHPIVQGLGGDRWTLLGIFLLACVWAPITEETMFRGALYNHLRSNRWSWIISSMLVGVLFAAVHPQGWTTIPALGSIGMSLAWIREWRSSIIGSMTAHALNNGVVLMLGILLLR